MDFIKNAGFGVQVAVVSGYLAAVGGHNVPSLDNLKKMFKLDKEVSVLAKHVGGRVLQTPFFLVGMVAGIVMDLISLVVNGANYIGQAVYNLGVALKAKVTGEEEVDSKAYYALDFVGSHKSLVDSKNASEACETTQMISEDLGPIAHNVSVFNGAVAKAAGQACTSVATTLGFGPSKQ